MAYAFLRIAATRGASITNDQGRVLRAEMLNDASADVESCQSFSADLRLLQRMIYEQAQDPVTLPNLWFSTVLTRDDIPAARLSDEQIGAVHSELVSRTRAHCGVRQAPTIVLRDGRTAVLWSGDALITSAVDVLIFPDVVHAGGLDDYLYLPWKSAAATLGEFVLTINGQVPAYVLRAIDANDEAGLRLWEALHAGARSISELAS